MNEMTANAVGGNPRLNKYLIVAMILAGVTLIGFLASRGQRQPGAVVASPEITTISQSVLEEQYGLRVNLVAVTAAGGFVDLRFKILDAEKASQLLQEGKGLPQLTLADSDVVLTAPEDSLPQGFKLEDDGSLYLMYPNARNAVEPGTPVTIVFGELQVEPIPAK